MLLRKLFQHTPNYCSGLFSVKSISSLFSIFSQTSIISYLCFSAGHLINFVASNFAYFFSLPPILIFLFLNPALLQRCLNDRRHIFLPFFVHCLRSVTISGGVGEYLMVISSLYCRHGLSLWSAILAQLFYHLVICPTPTLRHSVAKRNMPTA